MADEQIRSEVMVVIHSYGDRSKTDRDVLLEIARSMYQSFGDRAELHAGGFTVRYDPLAHDGNHEGHDRVLAFVLDPPAPAVSLFNALQAVVLSTDNPANTQPSGFIHVPRGVIDNARRVIGEVKDAI